MRYILILLALPLAAAPALAQFAVAEVSGTVVSADGVSLESVAVTARDPATGLRRSAVTTDRGAYAIAGLNPGNYLITFERSGFTTVNIHASHGGGRRFESGSAYQIAHQSRRSLSGVLVLKGVLCP